MQQEQKIIKNTEELEKGWDEFSIPYTSVASHNTASLYLSMINMLEFDKSDSILEVAVGAGHLAPYLLQNKKKDAKVYLTDLSKQFLAITKQRIELFNEKQQDQIYKFDLKNVQPFSQEVVHFEKYNTYLQQANSENLIDFENNSIQSYVSCLCLQLTTDPVKMIKESYRVLKSGGKACMSVWGNVERTSQLSIVPQVLEKHGVVDKERSDFHLNDRQKLIKMFETEGFTNVLVWDQFIPFNQITDEKQCEEFLNFVYIKEQIETAPKEKQDIIRQEIKDTYLNILKNKKTAFGLDALVVLATKP